ncbi:hypothetical protein [Limimaricola litoreus]|uniref:Cellulose biosynthesis protein BcsS n=1 Tax=Limimaricola litoreus TaxID=2955316 RepID=A0A9X2JMR7_9RHOB|nr:hypothetical protein [Limimaricola litoreus]MCP1167188.1 hypothetical protein [Limimaricola litoreus]
MRRRLVPPLCLSLILCICSGAAFAGAWPREEGTTFLSLGGNVALFDGATRPVHYDPTIYLEYGVTPRLTFGIDGYAADAGTAGSLFAWIRLPWRPERGGDVWAVSTGLGMTLLQDGYREATTRLGLHWGRGLETGWLAVDAQGQLGVTRLSHQAKVEGTWGRDLAPRWTGLIQAQTGYGLSGDIYAKIGGSFAWQAHETFELRLGLTRALTGDRGGGLTLESWWRF